MPDNKRKQLYDLLKADGYDVKSYEEFSNRYGSKEGAAKLHKFLGDEGYDVRSYEEFSSRYFGDMLGEPAAEPQGTGAAGQNTAQASVGQAADMNDRSDAMAEGQTDWERFIKARDGFNAAIRGWNVEAERINRDKENLAANRETLRNTYKHRQAMVDNFYELYDNEGKARYEGIKDVIIWV